MNFIQTPPFFSFLTSFLQPAVQELARQAWYVSEQVAARHSDRGVGCAEGGGSERLDVYFIQKNVHHRPAPRPSPHTRPSGSWLVRAARPRVLGGCTPRGGEVYLVDDRGAKLNLVGV